MADLPPTNSWNTITVWKLAAWDKRKTFFFSRRQPWNNKQGKNCKWEKKWHYFRADWKKSDLKQKIPKGNKNWSKKRYAGKSSTSEQREYRALVKVYNNSGYSGLEIQEDEVNNTNF